MSSPEPPAPITRSMIDLPAGRIMMRDEGSRRAWFADLQPYAIAGRTITRADVAALRGEPAGPDRPAVPMIEISWPEAIDLCNLLSVAAGLVPCYRRGADPDATDVIWDRAADGYRLPTEAEWEYACRAGDTGARYGDLDDIAWHRGNSGGRPQPVATRAPNRWGLFDMIGNVWEWCWDLFDPGVYGPYRVFRGGGWNDLPQACRASCRRKSHPSFRMDDLGFRVARTLPPTRRDRTWSGDESLRQ